MDFQTLIHLLGFCEEATARIQRIDASFNPTELQPLCSLLYDEKTADAGVQRLSDALSPDEDGMKILVCMLHCCLTTYEQYRACGISEQIFLDTMKFLSRFVNDQVLKYGRCVFTWAWWFHRQLGLREFRIGTLEYELCSAEGDRTISIHIPGDANLERTQLHRSVCDARAFLEKYFPLYRAADMFCDSWLLSPALHQVLPPSSRILGFQREFEILDWNKDSPFFLEWIYPDKTARVADLPENTSLQRNVKRFLLDGGKIGWAKGKLKNSYFAD